MKLEFKIVKITNDGIGALLSFYFLFLVLGLFAISDYSLISCVFWISIVPYGLLQLTRIRIKKIEEKSQKLKTKEKKHE